MITSKNITSPVFKFVQYMAKIKAPSFIQTRHFYTCLISSAALVGAATSPPLARGDQPGGTGASASTVAPDGLAAELNGNKIRISDLDLDIKRNPALSFYLSKGKTDDNLMRQVRIMALDRTIKRQLLIEAAHKSGKLDDADISAQATKLIESYKTQTGGNKIRGPN